jgi:hypothetical protein
MKTKNCQTLVSAKEELLLDVELQLKSSIDRNWFKKALVLRRVKL